ncbi:hypothetical protein Hanom_Chr01g00073881 [Helianthus anomalus]
MNTNERRRPLFMFVHLAKRTEFLVRVRLFNKRTNTNELPAECLVHLQPLRMHYKNNEIEDLCHYVWLFGLTSSIACNDLLVS